MIPIAVFWHRTNATDDLSWHSHSAKIPGESLPVRQNRRQSHEVSG